MKKSILTSAIATLSLVLFMSTSSLANCGISNSGDLTKSGAKSLSVSGTSDMDFGYLRFDVNKYVTENNESDLVYNSLDYLRFDVKNFITENSAESMELPLANEFENLRFDVNNFTASNPVNMTELPAKEFDYLHFDINKFSANENGQIDELPATE